VWGLRAVAQVRETLMNKDISRMEREMVQIKDKVREIKYGRVIQTFHIT
jgi:uncharacterized protein YdcH (DUF465 family)